MRTKQIILNPVQMAIASVRYQKNISLELGRGTGKSTILSEKIVKAVRTLPRATGLLVGSTFVQILSRTWPSTKEGLEMFGFYEDIHYVVGKCGKKLGYQMPFQAPNKWHNVIHFYSGFILVLVSLDDPNSGRGLNSYLVLGDEAALFNHKRLFDNVSSTNRAKKPQFEGNPLLNAEIYASSTPMTAEGRWFTDLEKEAIADPSEYIHFKANALINKKNLAPDWFSRMKKRATSDVQYNAEILNIRPKVTENSFYPQLNPKRHYYTASDYHRIIETPFQDVIQEITRDSSMLNTDIDPTKPLIISVDWGASINSMIVAQEFGNEFRVVKEFFVKSPKILDDLFKEEFIPFFKHQINRNIHFFYDRNGNSKVANSQFTYAEQAIFWLDNAGYTVIVETPHSLDPPHNVKFRVINLLLKHSGTEGFPTIKINRESCFYLTVSLENAPAKEDKNGLIKKDKSSERSKVIPQEQATHLSDTLDLPLYWKYKDLIDDHFQNRNYEPAPQIS